MVNTVLQLLYLILLLWLSLLSWLKYFGSGIKLLPPDMFVHQPILITNCEKPKNIKYATCQKVLGSIPDEVIEIFQSRTMALGLTTCNRNEYEESWGLGVAIS
jgi:hypothetical protein